jgi:hypothetical protein
MICNYLFSNNINEYPCQPNSFVSAAGRRQLYGAGREAWRLPARPALVSHSADDFGRPVHGCPL